MPSSYSNFYPFNLEIPEPYDTAFIMDDADLQAMLSSPSFHTPTPSHAPHALPISHPHTPVMRRQRKHTAPPCPTAEEGHRLTKPPVRILSTHKSRWESTILNESKAEKSQSTDDHRMTSNSEKTNPGPLENTINSNPNKRAAVMFGRARTQVGTIIVPARRVSITNDEDLASVRNPGLQPKRMVGHVHGVPYVEEKGHRLPRAVEDRSIGDIPSGHRAGVLVESSAQPRHQRPMSAMLTPHPSPSYPRARERTTSANYDRRTSRSSVTVRRRTISLVGKEGTCPSIVVEEATVDEIEVGNWA